MKLWKIVSAGLLAMIVVLLAFNILGLRSRVLHNKVNAKVKTVVQRNPQLDRIESGVKDVKSTSEDTNTRVKDIQPRVVKIQKTQKKHFAVSRDTNVRVKDIQKTQKEHYAVSKDTNVRVKDIQPKVDKIADKLGVTPPPPGKKVAVVPPPAGSSSGTSVASVPASCEGKIRQIANSKDDKCKKAYRYIHEAGLACFASDPNTRAQVDGVSKECEFTDEKGLRKYLNIAARSWRELTGGNGIQRASGKDLHNGWESNRGGDAVGIAFNGIRLFATYGFATKVAAKNLPGDVGEFFTKVCDNIFDKCNYEETFGDHGSGDGSGSGSGPAEPKPHVTNGSPGSGQDGGGYSGTVIGTTGNQDYSNTSVGLTQVSASGGTPPAMTNDAVDLKGQLVQGQSGTPIFTPMGAKTAVSSVDDGSSAAKIANLFDEGGTNLF